MILSLTFINLYDTIYLEKTLKNLYTMGKNNIYKAWCISIILIALPLVLGITLFIFNDTWVQYTGLVLAIAGTLGYGAASVATVPISERHVVELFKKPIAVLPSGYGIYLRAPGVLSAQVLPAGQIQFQFPGEDENTFKGSGNDSVPSGLAPNGLPWAQPYRIPTASFETAQFNESTMADGKKQEDYSKDKLSQRLTIEPSYVVIWKIKEGEEVLFVLNVGSIAEAFRRMRDEIGNGLQIEFSMRTPGMILETVEKINSNVSQRLKTLMERGVEGEKNSGWGTDIISTTLTQNDLGKTVAENLQKRANAQISSETTEIDAKAKSNARKIEGEGDADYIRKTKGADNEALAKELEHRAKHPGINRDEAIKNAGWKTVVGDPSKFLITHPTTNE